MQAIIRISEQAQAGAAAAAGLQEMQEYWAGRRFDSLIDGDGYEGEPPTSGVVGGNNSNLIRSGKHSSVPHPLFGLRQMDLRCAHQHIVQSVGI